MRISDVVKNSPAMCAQLSPPHCRGYRVSLVTLTFPFLMLPEVLVSKDSWQLRQVKTMTYFLVMIYSVYTCTAKLLIKGDKCCSMITQVISCLSINSVKQQTVFPFFVYVTFLFLYHSRNPCFLNRHFSSATKQTDL